ncbi:MAG: MFS transporter [Actinobacteria bacterium]|jgi:MFS family permease|nr:MFS transporter [Actinomycetota bacterium]NCV42455.1 MFS transporter [Actinomycetota bacterium]NCV82472.1 MFS transporter [Actinomycetota bacterium]NCX37551.1 MFS transporter [Actinomycetota bacterium]NCX38845.1 MFS transporter [Actinomycetota bacterium]
MKRIWLTRNLILLTIVSLAQDAASELLYPLLPILLTGVIGAAPLALGLIEGCAEAAAGFTKLISGKSSDRLGRKPFVISGYTLAGVGKAFVVVATSWPLVFLGRVTDRIGKGMRSAPRDALIADSVDKAHLGKAFGFHRTGDNIGAVIGPGIALIGLAMLDGDVRAVAMWALIPAIISGLLTLFIRENFVKPKKVEVKVKVKHPPLPAPLKKSITILVLIQLTNIPDALLLLRLYDIGFSTQSVVLSYMLFSAVTVLAAYPGGAIADKYSPRVVYSVGLVAFAAAYATLGLTQNHTVALMALALYGLFPALTDGVGKAWIAGLSEANHRGRAQGVYQASMNFAILGAGIWGGALWSKGDIQWPLVIAAIGALTGAIVLATIHLRRAQS